jgi:hypothetical protein
MCLTAKTAGQIIWLSFQALRIQIQTIIPLKLEWTRKWDPRPFLPFLFMGRGSINYRQDSPNRADFSHASPGASAGFRTNRRKQNES